jgi:hypothetical protein
MLGNTAITPYSLVLYLTPVLWAIRHEQNENSHDIETQRMPGSVWPPRNVPVLCRPFHDSPLTPPAVSTWGYGKGAVSEVAILSE